MRIVKGAEERKQEILDAAEMLFTSKGYNKTTIIDILEAVGIAKGTFYYHFKSKEEVMEAMINRIAANDAAAAERILLDRTLTPIEKIFRILKVQQPKEGSRKEQLIEQFHSPANAEIHQKSIAQSVLSLSPVLAEVVKQGNDEGLFHAEHPKEIMEVLILAGQNLFDPSMFQWTQEELRVKINAFISMMEILLGAKKGCFSCMNEILAGAEGGEENAE